MIDKFFVRSYPYKVPRYKIEDEWKGVCGMRISSISVAQPINHNYRTRVKHLQAQPVQAEQPTFKGAKAGAYGLLGTIAGGFAAAVLSGGALLPILLCSAAGTTGGCIYGSSKEDNHNDDHIDYDPCYPNYRDY